MILVRAYYTPGAYEREVGPLHESLEKFKLYYETTRIHGLESWRAAVLLKPTFILESLRASSAEAVFYTDADSEFRQRPDWSIFANADVSWHTFRRASSHPVENLVGSMWFRNTPDVRTFVEEWAKETAKPMYAGRFTPEQDSLRTVVDRIDKLVTLRFLPMPPAYCWFDDCRDVYGDTQPVIFHRQASRVHRHAKPEAEAQAEEAKAEDAPPAPPASPDRERALDLSTPESGAESRLRLGTWGSQLPDGDRKSQ